MSLRWHLCGILSEEPKSLVEAFAEPAEAKGSDVVSLEIVSVQSSQQSAEQTSVSQGKQKIFVKYFTICMYCQLCSSRVAHFFQSLSES